MSGKNISHFEIHEKISSGIMGVLYKATDTKLKRPVVLKFLPSELTRDSEAKTRFIQEAWTAAATNHPSIVTIYEINDFEDQIYIAMEYVEGQTLKDMINAGKRAHQPLPIGQAIAIAVQIAQGLQAAHEKGIVHRDIKPSNVIVSKRDEVKIIDFGLAKLAGQVRLTQSGSTMGTAAYMSPEQARGDTIDLRTDIWSLGVVLYEMLSGQLPFPGEHGQAVIHSILKNEPEPLDGLRPGIPAEIQDLVGRCLEKNRNRRYQQVNELLADLHKLAGNTQTEVILGLSAEVQKKPRSLFRLAAIGSVVLLCLLAVPTMVNMIKGLISRSAIPNEKHLAILPLNTIGRDPAVQAFSDGLIESLTSKLTQLEQSHRSLWIVPASELRGSDITSPSKARKTLGVNLVVTGSIQRGEGMIQLTLNLVDAQALRQLQSAVIVERLANISTFQNRVIAEVAAMLNIEVKPDTGTIFLVGGTSMSSAYELFLKARGYLLRYENEDSVNMAIDLFKQAIELDQGYALAFAGLGEAYWRKYELAKDPKWVTEAQNQCQRAIAISPNLVPAYITLGMISRGSGRFQDAISFLQRAMKFDPVNSAAYLELAIAYEGVGKLHEAEVTYKKAIEIKSDYWAGYNNLGVYYYLYGRFAEAEKMFHKVIELTPDNYRGYNNLIGIYFKLGQTGRSRFMFEKSIAIKPNADAYSNMGTIYFFQGLYADAKTMYEKAVNLQPGDYIMWANLGDCYRLTADGSLNAKEAYRQAIALVNRQVAVNPNDVELRSSLALCHAKAGDYQQAIKEIGLARQAVPRSLTVIQKSILTYELAGERERAIRCLEEYVRNRGFIEELQKDPDLAKLRSDARFLRLIKVGNENGAPTKK